MKIPKALLPFKRKTWIPIVKDGDGSLTDSKFAGTPYLLPNEDYPLCPNCGNPIQLFLQLNLNQIPKDLDGAFGEGLIQLFYCTNYDAECDIKFRAWEPFSKVVIARLVEVKSETLNIINIGIEDAIPPKQIIAWTEADDFPSWAESENLEIELTDEEWESMENFPLSGEKLAGWANWVQGFEYPNCRICGETMRLVFQIDSHQNLAFTFGDVGIGHLTQCPIHKEEVGFGWACG